MLGAGRIAARGALVGSVALVGSLVAAGGTPALAQDASGKITYAIWGDPAELSNQIALVEMFEAEFPDISVDVTVYTDGKQH